MEEPISTGGASPTGGSGSGPQSSAPAGTSVSSGTASEAMIKAASAAVETAPVVQPKADPTVASGDTSKVVAPLAVADPTKPATGAPPATDPAVPPAATTGEAPEARITAATRNARIQALTDVGQAIGLNGPITKDSLEDLTIGMGLLRELREDRQGFAQRLNDLIGQGKAPVAPGAAAKEWPAASLTASDGRTAYSADDVKQIVDIVKQEITQSLTGELRPLMDWKRNVETAEERADSERQAGQLATNALSEARAQLPHFKEHEAVISATLKQMDPRLIAQLGPIGAMYRAYNWVLKTKVFPGIDTAADARIRAEYEKKAGGSSVITPNGTGGDQKVVLKDGDIGGLAAHMAKLAEQPSL